MNQTAANRTSDIMHRLDRVKMRHYRVQFSHSKSGNRADLYVSAMNESDATTKAVELLASDLWFHAYTVESY